MKDGLQGSVPLCLQSKNLDGKEAEVVWNFDAHRKEA